MMIRCLSLTGVLVLAAMAVADEPDSPAAKQQHVAPPVAPGPGQPAEGRRLNARRGGSQADQKDDRGKRPGGRSAGNYGSGGGLAQLLQGGFDLRLVSWGDRSGVPTSGKKLVVIGIDHKGLLHLRIFDAGGKRVMDTDETRLSSEQAVAIVILKQQLSGLSPPQELTGASKARVMRKVTLIALQTSQDLQRQLHQSQPRQLPKRSRVIRSRPGEAMGSSPTPGRSTEQDAGDETHSLPQIDDGNHP